MWGAILGWLAGEGLKYYEADRARKKAHQERDDERRAAAWNALMQAAAGGVPQYSPRPIPEAEPYSWSGAANGLVNTIAQDQQKTQQEADKVKAEAKANEAESYRRQQDAEALRLRERAAVSDESRLAETVRANKAQELRAWSRDLQDTADRSATRTDAILKGSGEDERWLMDYQLRKQALEQKAAEAANKGPTGDMTEKALADIAYSTEGDDLAGQIARLEAGRGGKPVPPPKFKYPDAARSQALRKLRERYGWPDEAGLSGNPYLDIGGIAPR